MARMVFGASRCQAISFKALCDLGIGESRKSMAGQSCGPNKNECCQLSNDWHLSSLLCRIGCAVAW